MRKYSRLLVGVLLLSGFWGAVCAGAGEFSVQGAYFRNVDARVVTADADRIVVEFINTNAGINDRIKPTWSKTFYLIVPPHAAQEVSLKSYEVEVYRDGAKPLAYTDQATSSPFRMPDVRHIIGYKDQGQFRSVLLASLKYSPCQGRGYIEGVNTQMVFRRLTAEIRFSGVPALPKRNVSPDELVSPLSRTILKSLVVNYDAISRYALARPDGQKLFEKAIAWTSLINARVARGAVAKTTVYEPGIYAVRYEDLRSAGVPADSLTPERLRLIRRGADVPLRLDVRKTESLSSGDTIYFYAAPFDRNQEPYNTYWLFAEPETENLSLKRIPVITMEPATGTDFVPITAGASVIKEYRNEEYNSGLPLPSPSGRWYWDRIPAGQYRNYTFEIDSLAADSKNANLLLVVSTVEKVKTSRYVAYINRKRVEEVKWSGFGCRQSNLSIATALLREGTNEIGIYVPPAEKEPQSSELYFIGLELTYTRSLQRHPERAQFAIAGGPQNGGKVHLQFGQGVNKDLESVHVFNVSKPESPIDLPMQFLEGPASYGVVDNASQRSEYVTATPLTSRKPAAIAPAKPLPLADISTTTSYVIISHKRFIPYLAPFVEARQRSGFSVNVVNVDDIYDIFGYGEKSCTAIKDFIKYLYNVPSEERLDYVLLVGESSDYVGNPNEMPSRIQEDLVPVWGYCMPSVGARGDNQYSLICGSDDLPDLSIGRFSVDSVEDVAAYVKKALYYTSQKAHGEWSARHVFAADDDAEFPQLADDLIAKRFPSWMDTVRVYEANYPYEDFYRIRDRKRSSAATSALVNGIDRGAVTTNYFGHGGPNIWTSERLFHLQDVPLLRNFEHLSFITCSTCDTAWLDYPTTPVRYSLGEMFAKAPDGGAICVFGPTTGASPSDHKFLMDHLFDGLLEHGIHRTGDLTLYAKLVFFMEQQIDYVNDQFVLLGDPGVVLPAATPPSFTLAVDPSVADSCSTSTVRIEATIADPLWGWADVFSKTPGGNHQLLEPFVRIANGRFALEHVFAPDAAEGEHLFTAHVLDGKSGSEKKGVGSFRGEQSRLEITASYDKPPGREYLLAGDRVTITIVVKNLTDIHHRDAQMRVYREQEAEPFIARQIEIPPRGSVTQTFQMEATAGVQYFKISVMPRSGDKKSCEVSKDLFIPVEPGVNRVFLGMNPQEILTTPDRVAVGDKPTFNVTIHNLSGIPQRDVHCLLSEEGVGIIGEQDIAVIPAHDSAAVTFTSSRELSAGEHTLRAIVGPPETSGTTAQHQLSATRILRVNRNADLMVVPGSLQLSSAHFYTGETVYISARVRNAGEEPASNFPVEAFVDEPWNRAKLIENAFKTPNVQVGSLAPGEEKEVTIRWDRQGPPRTDTVFVVANSDRKVRETDYTNNVASTEVRFLAYGNLAVPKEGAKVSRKVLHRGETVTIQYAVLNTGSNAMLGVPIEYYEYAQCGEPMRYGESYGSHPLARVGRDAHSIVWKPAPYTNVFKIVLNPYREIHEDTYGDNTLILPFDYAVSKSDLKTASDGFSRMGDLLLLGTTDFATIDPAGAIRCTEFEGAPGFQLEVSPELLAEPLPQGKDNADAATENRWILRRNWLEASPKENPEPARFSFPMKGESDTTVYDVYIHVQSMARHNGYPATRLRLRCEGEGDFKDYDFAKEFGVFPGKRYYIGRYDVADGRFDVTIDDVNEEYWTIVNMFEFVPLKAGYISPPVETGTWFLHKRTIEFKMSASRDAQGRVVAKMRCGKEKGRAGITWQPWQPISFSEDGASPRYTVDKALVQWQVELFPSVASNPVLEDFGVRIE